MTATELQKLVGLLRSRPSLFEGEVSIEQMRASMEASSFAATDAASVSEIDAEGVRGEWVTVADSDPNRRLLYLHGGGYIVGSPTTHRRLCEGVAQAAGCAVLNLEYRLAPEHPFPAAVEDALAGLTWIRDNGPDGAAAAESVFVAGDSAGGGLTLATLLAARDRGLELPNAGIAISAWVDMTISGASMESRAAADPIVTSRQMITDMSRMYVGDADPTDALASPLFADYAGLPPLLLQVGDAEVLLSDTTVVAERARAAGVEVVEEVWDEMIHVWHAFAPMLSEGQAAIDRIGEFISQHA